MASKSWLKGLLVLGCGGPGLCRPVVCYLLPGLPVSLVPCKGLPSSGLRIDLANHTAGLREELEEPEPTSPISAHH